MWDGFYKLPGCTIPTMLTSLFLIDAVMRLRLAFCNLRPAALAGWCSLQTPLGGFEDQSPSFVLPPPNGGWHYAAASTQWKRGESMPSSNDFCPRQKACTVRSGALSCWRSTRTNTRHTGKQHSSAGSFRSEQNDKPTRYLIIATAREYTHSRARSSTLLCVLRGMLGALHPLHPIFFLPIQR
jgi:hypothetical protein